MRIARTHDVVVVGSGLAGLSAALRAAALGARVCLVTESQVFGGSSFSEATWGLGMVSEPPASDSQGPESLFKALCAVGMGMNDPNLAKELVGRSDDALALLRSVGARLLDPSNPDQREFVACFDSRVRSWHGFVGRESRDAFRRALDERGVDVRTGCVPLSLLQDDEGAVCGVLTLRSRLRDGATLHNLCTTEMLCAPTIVIATGGTCGLYGHFLCSPSCRGVGHVLAADAGARLVNLEFQQLMLGTLSPARGIVFNEKLYRWSRFSSPSGHNAFAEHGVDASRAEEALEAHSWHGPYTTRLKSHLVEDVLCAGSADGMPYQVTYEAAMLGDDAPEFVRTYLAWLRDVRGVDPKCPMGVGLFAHSSNGGIRITPDAGTGIPGLLACGECAGGVHGADRIGGLASMTATTFGLIAGETAAARRDEPLPDQAHLTSHVFLCPDGAEANVRQEVARALDASCLALRCEGGLSTAGDTLLKLEDGLLGEAHTTGVRQLEEMGGAELAQVARGHEALMRVRAARAIVRACRLRTETRGPHHRTDHPETDPAQARPLALDQKELWPEA